MKKIVSLTLSLMLILSTLMCANVVTVFADELDPESHMMYTKSSNSVTVTGIEYGYEAEEVEIPSEINGLPVRQISGTFNNASYLTSVIIPDSVTAIVTGAFVRADNLLSITVSENNENYASQDGLLFNKDKTELIFVPRKRQECTIPASVTTINFDHAFFRCDDLVSITVAEDNEAFSGKDGIVFNKDKTELIFVPTQKDGEYIVPDSVTKIHYNSNNKITKISIPDSVTTIAMGALSAYNNLEAIVVSEDNENFASVDDVLFNKEKTELIQYPHNKEGAYIIPDGVTTIGYSAFQGSKATSIKMPNSVTTMKQNAFAGCRQLTKINLPDNITEIGIYAFTQCFNLPSITLPRETTKISMNAFESCLNLTEITIFNKVDTISNSAFSSCKKLTDVYYYGTEEEWNAINIGSSNKPLQDATIHYLGEWEEGEEEPEEPEVYDEIDPSLFSYEPIGETEARILFLNDNFESTGVIVPDTIDGRTVIGIGQSLFGNEVRTNLKYVSLPETVTEIPADAFYRCAGLKKVSMPGVTRIGEWAFFECTSLANITIPDGVEAIEQKTFYRCYSLETVTIPDSVTEIGDYAFEDCTALKEVNLPTHLIDFGKNVFLNCSSLEEIYLADDLTYISDGLFSGCSNLKQLQLSDNITYIGYNAFTGCKLFTEMNLPENLEFLGAGAYAGTGITEAKFLDNTTSVPTGHFADCDNLESVTIPNGVKSIGTYAFSDCDNLTEIHIPYSVDSIGAEAFEDCNSLTDVYFDGPQSAWNHISFGYHNDPLLRANLHFNEEPKDVDLAVTKVSASQSTVSDGDDINIYCMVRNNGSEDAVKKLKIDFYYNGILFDTVYYEDIIPAGGFKVIQCSNTKSVYPGIHSIRAIINNNDNQSEVDKSNNALKSRLIVAD